MSVQLLTQSEVSRPKPVSRRPNSCGNSSGRKPGPSHDFSQSGFFARLGKTASPRLGRARVLVIGCGRVGGYLALLLVQHAVASTGGRLTCLDKGKVERVNLPRSPFFELADVHRNKAVALRDQIARRVPGCHVDAQPIDFLRLSVQQRVKLVREHDLVIAAADDRAVQVAINRAVISARALGSRSLCAVWPGIWVGRGNGAGTAGEVIWSDRRSGPCYKCVTDFRGSEHRRPGSQIGNGVDLLPLVHLALKVSLQLLDSRPAMRHVTSDRGRNLVLVHGASMPKAAAGAVFDPMSMRLVRTTRRNACPACAVSRRTSRRRATGHRSRHQPGRW